MSLLTDNTIFKRFNCPKPIEFRVLSRAEAERLKDEDLGNRRFIIISIHGSDERPANIQVTKNVLFEQFDDIEQSEVIVQGKHTFIPFSKFQAKKIFDYVNEMKPELIIVHCHAGVCRSAAVAAALSKIMFNRDDDIFDSKVPNMWVYKTLLEYWFCDQLKHEGEYIQDIYWENNKKKFTL